MKNILKLVFQRLRKMNQSLIFFQLSKYVKKEELDPIERKAIELYFLKKIFQFLQDLVLVTKYPKKF